MHCLENDNMWLLLVGAILPPVGVINGLISPLL